MINFSSLSYSERQILCKKDPSNANNTSINLGVNMNIQTAITAFRF
jgi:hypothetical protein